MIVVEDRRKIGERLRVIRDLKERGYTLKMVHAALVHEHNMGLPLDEPPETLRLRDVAERSGLPPEMVRALEASHLLRPHRLGRSARYSDARADRRTAISRPAFAA